MRVRFLRFFLPGIVTAGIALIGADIGHGVVALLGRWGAVHFASYAHLAVIPALFAGMLLLGGAVLVIFGDALARATGLGGDWLAASARIIARLPWSRFLPAVFVLQIAALFMMERVEQTIAFGHPLGLVAALGAPLLLALVVQALSALAVGIVTMLVARAVVAVLVMFARAIRPVFQRRRRSTGLRARALRRAHNGGSSVPVPAPLARRIANRPPPLVAIAA